MKRILILFLLAYSFCFYSSSFASYSKCSQAVPDYQTNFCSSFKSVAECHCEEMGLPKGMCQDMNVIYNRMISMFGSQQKACQYQSDTSFQTCMDDWNCYRVGGKDSLHRLCSSTGKHC